MAPSRCQRAVLLVLVLALARSAAADSDKLAQARAAIDRVAYTQAQPLLVAALQEGGASPTTLIEIYRLLGTTATVLGQSDVAERYYRRWLALEPSAQLPDEVAPKLREPFVAAQVYMAARSPLSARAEIRDDEVEVLVVSDPLAMVAAIEIDGARKSLGVDRRAKASAAGHGKVAVVLVDEFGNHLVELEAIAEAVPERSARVVVDAGEPVWWRRPVTWLVPTVVIGANGVAFALGARSAQGQLDEVIAHSSDHYFGDAKTAQDRRDRDALIANLSFAAAGACAITAGVMYLVRPHARVAVVPAPSGTGAGVAIAW